MELEPYIEAVGRWLECVHTESADLRVDTAKKRYRLAVAHLSDGPARLLDMSIYRLSAHESTHAVVAVKMGVSVSRARIHANGSGSVEYRADTDTASGFLSMTLIELAGTFGEIVTGSGDGFEERLRGSADLLSSRRNLDSHNALMPTRPVECITAARLAASAVLANLPTIERVASVLRECGELDGASLGALCGRSQ